MAEDWKKLSKKRIDEDHQRGHVLPGASYALTGLIEILHSKGVLSDADQDALLQAWDEANSLSEAGT